LPKSGPFKDPVAEQLFHELVADDPSVDQEFLREAVEAAVALRRANEGLAAVESLEARLAQQLRTEGHEELEAEARSQAESRVYSLNNPYLSDHQKAIVEAIYQMPLGVFDFILLGHFAFAPQNASYVDPFIYAAAGSLVVGALAWHFMSTTIATIGFAFCGPVGRAVKLALTGYLLANTNWVGVAIGVVAMTGLTSIVAPSTWLYNMKAGGMHPKYRIAKRLFDVVFPFESMRRSA